MAQPPMEANVNRTYWRVLGIAATLLGHQAVAGDLAPLSYAAPAPWYGAYAGFNVGYEWGSVASLPLNPSGIVGGVQAGYNWQSGQFMLGAETDMQLAEASDTFAAYQFSNPWFGTLRWRAGLALSSVLFYATAGLAYGGTKLNFAGLTETHTDLGWAAGAGIEVGFAPAWSAKAEYLYYDLGNQTYLLTGISNGFTSGVVRLGINYHFHAY
jgi:outer membrane immunogenic protein